MTNLAMQGSCLSHRSLGLWLYLLVGLPVFDQLERGGMPHPAHYADVLQVNRPFSKPLVLLMPKGMHLHRHATSALQDFGPHTFFNRIIDDGKVRHARVAPEPLAALRCTCSPPVASE